MLTVLLFLGITNILCQAFVEYSGEYCEAIVNFNITVNSSQQSIIDTMYVEDYIDTFPSWTPKQCRKSLRVISCLTSYLPYKYPPGDNELCQDTCIDLSDYCNDFATNVKNYNEGEYSFVFTNCSVQPNSGSCYSEVDLSMDSYPSNQIDDSACPSPLVVSSSSAESFVDGSSCAYPCPNYVFSKSQFLDITNTMRATNALSLLGSLSTLYVWVVRALNKDDSSRTGKESEFVIAICIAVVLSDFTFFLILVEDPFKFLCSDDNETLSRPLCTFQAACTYASLAFALVWAAAQSIHVWLIVVARLPPERLYRYKIAYRSFSLLFPALTTTIMLSVDGLGNDLHLPQPLCWLKTDLDYYIYLGVYTIPNSLLLLILIGAMSHVCYSLAWIVYSARRYRHSVDDTSSEFKLDSHNENDDTQVPPLRVALLAGVSKTQSPDSTTDNTTVLQSLYEAFRVNRRMIMFIVLFGVLSLSKVIGSALASFGRFGSVARDSAEDFEICLLNNADASTNVDSICGSSPDNQLPIWYAYIALISSTSYGTIIFLIYGPHYNANKNNLAEKKPWCGFLFASNISDPVPLKFESKTKSLNSSGSSNATKRSKNIKLSVSSSRQSQSSATGDTSTRGDANSRHSVISSLGNNSEQQTRNSVTDWLSGLVGKSFMGQVIRETEHSEHWSEVVDDDDSFIPENAKSINRGSDGSSPIT